MQYEEYGRHLLSLLGAHDRRTCELRSENTEKYPTTCNGTRNYHHTVLMCSRARTNVSSNFMSAFVEALVAVANTRAS